MNENSSKATYLDPFEKCSRDCIAQKPMTDTASGDEHSECPVIDSDGNYTGKEGFSEVCVFAWDLKPYKGMPRCSECGWLHGDHRAEDDACPAIPPEALAK